MVLSNRRRPNREVFGQLLAHLMLRRQSRSGPEPADSSSSVEGPPVHQLLLQLLQTSLHRGNEQAPCVELLVGAISSLQSDLHPGGRWWGS